MESQYYRVILRRDEKFKVRPEAEILDGMLLKLVEGDIVESGIYKGERRYYTDTYTSLLFAQLKYDIPSFIAEGDLVKL